MNQKFSKKELERLGCTEEEIKLVIEYQKKLPIIVDNDEIDLFCVNSRSLYVELRGTDTTNYSRWFNRSINNYKFYENVDFVAISPIGRDNIIGGGDLKSKDYLLSIDMSKQLSMVEKSDIGVIARRYFILMEKLVKKNIDWWTTRNKERKNYIPMCKALSESIQRTCGRCGDDTDFKFEANRLNIIVTGDNAQSIKLHLGANPNELTRDRLLNDYNEKIDFLQEQNILLFSMDLPIVKRLNMLIKFFDTKYPDAKPLRQYKDREYLLKARNDMLDELIR